MLFVIMFFFGNSHHKFIQAQIHAMITGMYFCVDCCPNCAFCKISCTVLFEVVMGDQNRSATWAMMAQSVEHRLKVFEYAQIKFVHMVESLWAIV